MFIKNTTIFVDKFKEWIKKNGCGRNGNVPLTPAGVSKWKKTAGVTTS